jgi:transcription initiation factor IIE alpha subunit
MNTQKLLALRELNPTDKIILLVINENTVWNQCIMTSQEIANAAALTRKVTLDSIQKLEELDFITCKVEGAYRKRITKITQRLTNLIKE